MKLLRNLSLTFLVCSSSVVSAQQKIDTADSNVIRVWPEGKTPGKTTGLPEESTNEGTLRITNVSIPEITIYKAKGIKSAPAIIICPGGGYGRLAFDKEGTEIATWLNSVGITSIVLKYRVPGNRDGAFQDIQRAIRLVRSQSKALSINPKQVGIIGFSAGGHLAARLTTNFTEGTYSAIDDADKGSIRPDFTILVYPAYLNKGEVLDPQLKIKSNIPPVFMVHTEDDTAFVPGTKLFEKELQEKNAAYEFLILPTGGHGYGLRSKKEIKVWPEHLLTWLKKNRIAN